MSSRERDRGLVYGVLAYGLWGVVPLFWRLLLSVPPIELLAHRVFWGLGAFGVLAAGTGQLGAVRAGFADRRTIQVMALSGALLAVNWGTFILAVATQHLLDASLGYFINPLVSVALGTVVLGERLRRLQWIALALAATGVIMLTARVGHLPWIALVLATTFGIYGLVRKTAAVNSLVGSTLETALMFPLALVYLGILAASGTGSLGHASLTIQVLLVATGVITAVPLLLFTSAARRLRLSTLGFLQYLAPTLQFLLAVLVFHEPFVPIQGVAFALIWTALVVFSVDAIRQSR
jgi:chloramphenicol-sensitive protein RarD